MEPRGCRPSRPGGGLFAKCRGKSHFVAEATAMDREPVSGESVS